MKTVKYDLVLQVHDDLDEDKLKDTLGNYLVNNETAKNLVEQVIGELDPPENFSIKSMELKSKRKIKNKKVKSGDGKKSFDKSWNTA